MTQQQLAVLSGVARSAIAGIERGDPTHCNMKMSTLKKLASALGCDGVVITLRSKNVKGAEGCLPLGPDLPAGPKLKRTLTVEARTRALSHERSPWSVRPPSKHQQLYKGTSGKPGSGPEPKT